MHCTCPVPSPHLMVSFLLHDFEKSYVNAGKKFARHRHFFRYYSAASGIGIPAPGSVRYRWSRTSPALPKAYIQSGIPFMAWSVILSVNGAERCKRIFKK